MSALDRALSRSRSVSTSAHSYALQLKRAGSLPDVFANATAGLGAYGQFSQFQDQGANKQRYSQYRGWVYSAINALATEAAMQPVKAGKMTDPDKAGSPSGTKAYLKSRNENRIKGFELNKMPERWRSKAADNNLEIIPDHAILDVLQKPNSIQHGFQFVYSFVANLCLTGWGYILGGTNEEGKLEFFSVPTTWITPDHTDGAFSKFWLQNPKNPIAGQGVELTRDQVGFAYLPNPADPLLALAPANAQMLAIKIDDHIQTSQAAFFENSVFPGAIVTMGKNPHPDVPGGVRPRLTAPQRRQVYGAIKKVMGGVANYGNPAIVDGLIESIERLQASQNEIGWEKSEKAVRTRILSAFSVHPFILGEEMAGSYAQAYVVGERFCKKVNVFLALLSELMTNFAPDFLPDIKKPNSKPSKKDEGKDKLLIWWEEASVKDPSMEKSLWEGARTRGDITQNEFRAFMGQPPDTDKNESVIDKSSLMSITSIAAQVTGGTLLPDQAMAILIGMGLPDDVAKKIAGTGPAQADDSEVDDQDPNHLAGYQQGLDDAGDAMDSDSFKSAVESYLGLEDIIQKSAVLNLEVKSQFAPGDVHRVGKVLAREVMPGYGQIYSRNLDDGEVELWYVGGDGDPLGFGNKVEEELMDINGVAKIYYESESYPKDNDWVQIYPKK